MARSRFPAPFATIQLVLRVISLALSVATIIAAAYVSVKYGNGTAMVGAFIAAVWTMAVDTAEIAGLADRTRRVRRCTEGSLGCLDILTMLLNAILPVVNLLVVTGLSWECGGRPQAECEEEERFRSEALNAAFVTWVLPVVVA